MRRSFLFRVPWPALGIAIAALLTGHWAAIGLAGEHLFVHWWPVLEHYQLLVSLLALVAFVVASVVLYHNRQAFTMARSLSRHLCEPHPVVILLVSTPNIHIQPPTTAELPFPLHVTDANGASIALQGRSLDEDIAALDAIRWNWQQLLRAVAPHTVRQTLKRIHLIGSPGPEGSFAHLASCKALLEHYVTGVEVLQVEEPIDFEDFNALVHCMRHIIHQEQHHGRREQDMIIDVTGGLKTTSIAGASITFSSQVQFQYVQTVKAPQVYAYDVIYHPHVSLEEG